MLKQIYKWGLTKSLAVYHAGASACNNCDIEILDLLTPKFDVERFGITLVGSPRQADVLLVTGVANRQITPRLIRLYEQIPKPKLVIAIGSCACNAQMFRDSYNVVRPIDEIIPVDAYLPGCPPKPEAMINAILKLVAKLK